jgi:hypothetical protein
MSSSSTLAKKRAPEDAVVVVDDSEEAVTIVDDEVDDEEEEIEISEPTPAPASDSDDEDEDEDGSEGGSSRLPASSAKTAASKPPSSSSSKSASRPPAKKAKGGSEDAEAPGPKKRPEKPPVVLKDSDRSSVIGRGASMARNIALVRFLEGIAKGELQFFYKPIHWPTHLLLTPTNLLETCQQRMETRRSG